MRRSAQLFEESFFSKSDVEDYLLALRYGVHVDAIRAIRDYRKLDASWELYYFEQEEERKSWFYKYTKLVIAREREGVRTFSPQQRLIYKYYVTLNSALNQLFKSFDIKRCAVKDHTLREDYEYQVFLCLPDHVKSITLPYKEERIEGYVRENWTRAQYLDLLDAQDVLSERNNWDLMDIMAFNNHLLNFLPLLSDMERESSAC